MGNSFFCHYCKATSPLTNDTLLSKYVCFIDQNLPYQYAMRMGKELESVEELRDTVQVNTFRCPGCGNHSIWIEGIGAEVKGTILNFKPLSNALQFPDYIPQSIREDYEEACSIVDLSPKASATLSRRCLQGMIRDYWSIEGKSSLQQEIDAIKDKVDPQVNRVLHSLRQLGNIGAHPERETNLIVDIEPGEAEKMIKLIEYLMSEWYIKQHETEQLLSEVNSINDQKKEARKTN